MVNNGERNIYKLDVDFIKCNTCKITYNPTKIDIPTKNPNTYFKNCFSCREKKQLYMKEYSKKNLI